MDDSTEGSKAACQALHLGSSMWRGAVASSVLRLGNVRNLETGIKALELGLPEHGVSRRSCGPSGAAALLTGWAGSHVAQLLSSMWAAPCWPPAAFLQVIRVYFP